MPGAPGVPAVKTVLLYAVAGLAVTWFLALFAWISIAALFGA